MIKSLKSRLMARLQKTDTTIAPQAKERHHAQPEQDLTALRRRHAAKLAANWNAYFYD